MFYCNGRIKIFLDDDDDDDDDDEMRIFFFHRQHIVIRIVKLIQTYSS